MRGSSHQLIARIVRRRHPRLRRRRLDPGRGEHSRRPAATAGAYRDAVRARKPRPEASPSWPSSPPPTQPSWRARTQRGLEPAAPDRQLADVAFSEKTRRSTSSSRGLAPREHRDWPEDASTRYSSPWRPRSPSGRPTSPATVEATGIDNVENNREERPGQPRRLPVAGRRVRPRPLDRRRVPPRLRVRVPVGVVLRSDPGDQPGGDGVLQGADHHQSQHADPELPSAPSRSPRSSMRSCTTRCVATARGRLDTVGEKSRLAA